MLATVFVRGRGGNGIKEGSISLGSGLWIGRRVEVRVVAGATGIVERRGLRTVSVEATNFSEEELMVSELLDVCVIDPVSVNFGFISEICGAEVKFLFADESGDESRTTTVSEGMIMIEDFMFHYNVLFFQKYFNQKFHF